MVPNIYNYIIFSIHVAFCNSAWTIYFSFKVEYFGKLDRKVFLRESCTRG